MKMWYLLSSLLLGTLVAAGCGTGAGNPNPQTFSIGGVVSGLTGTIVLQNNGDDDLTLVSDGAFTFGTRLSDHAVYSVIVKTASEGESCTVQNGSGMVTGASVTNVAVTCMSAAAPSFKLTASDGNAGDEFGYDVATSSDGNTVVVGARQLQAAYVYKWDGASWGETKLSGSNGLYGSSVSISSDGNTIAVGAYTETVGLNLKQGAAYVYKWNGSSWSGTKLTASDGAAQDLFGIDVAVSGDGNTAIVGAWFAHEGAENSQGPGLAYIYKWEGADWAETKLNATDGAAGDEFGFSVAISADGNTAVVGARGDGIGAHAYQGSAYVYTWNGADWNESKLIASDGASSGFFGGSVSISSDGTIIAIGASGLKDVAYVYTKSGSSWNEFKIVPSDGPIAGFGTSVALSSDGNTLAVGAIYEGSGSVYVYAWNGSSWDEGKLIDAEGKTMDCLGSSVAVSADGSTVVAGAVPYIDGGGSGPGYVDIFR